MARNQDRADGKVVGWYGGWGGRSKTNGTIRGREKEFARDPCRLP